VVIIICQLKNEASLAFPVLDINSNAIKSFWGDNRDGGTRLHKGVDIFAPRNTPVTAVANGVITRTGTNNLGGKVVWLFAEGKSFYYAHLDSQLVSTGNLVDVGDTLGLVGNTGNAKHTPPHLHFGIYLPGKGAVNPLPFIKNIFHEPERINVNRELIGRPGRVKARTASFISGEKKVGLSRNIPLKIYGASGSRYRVELPDGRAGFISAANVEASGSPVTFKSINSDMKFYSSPVETSEISLSFEREKSLPVYGTFNNFLLISFDGNFLWTKK
jgi:peptidoglycan LD-endopeptidase LytH